MIQHWDVLRIPSLSQKFPRKQKKKEVSLCCFTLDTFQLEGQKSLLIMGRYSTVQAFADNNPNMRKVTYDQAAGGAVAAADTTSTTFIDIR
jgi:hypothetical protein